MNAIRDWLGAGYAGTWIEWDPAKPLFQYAYIGDLPASDPPPQLADLIAQEFASSRDRTRSPLRITIVTAAMIAESQKNRDG